MKKILLILTLVLAGSALASKTTSNLSNLTIVDAEEFFASDFWATPAGKAFWETSEGKLVLKVMLRYQAKMEAQSQP
jgi:hypothetical protein